MYRYIMLLFFLAVASCGGSDPSPSSTTSPINVTIEQTNDHHSYLTMTVNQIEFLDGVGDTFGKGEFRLYMIVGDNKDTFGGLFCPEPPLKIVPQDRITPCPIALSIPEKDLNDELFVIIMGVDEDNGTLATDLASGAGSSLISYGLVKAAESALLAKYAVSATSPSVIVAGLALDVLIGYTGDEIQEWVEERDIIGFQVLHLHRREDWAAGKQFTFETSDKKLRIVFTVERTATPREIVIQSEPSVSASSENIPVATLNLESNLPSQVVADWQQGQLAFLASENGNKELFSLNLTENMTPHQLFARNEFLLGPVLSPSGSKIVLYEPNGQLFIVNSQTGDLQINPHECTAPVWSSDEQRLLCRSAEPATFDIIDASTGELLQQISRPSGSLFPHWSPTRNEIVFVISENGTTTIHRMSLDNGSTVLLAGDATENYAPSWSPDGNWVAYQSNQNSSNSEIWIVNRNGQDAQQLTDTPGGGWSRAPYWSPDGEWLAFVSNRAGSIGDDYGEIFVILVATGETFQVTFTGGTIYDWRVSWSISR